MSKEKTKVYLYTRVSTAMQIDGYSLDAQKSRMKAFCEFNDYEIVGEYEEQYSRDPAVHKKYGRAWKRIRDSYVQTHPFCEKCFEQGVLTPVEEVHHKVPISQGGTHARSNLMSLCRSCHTKIHHEIGDR